MRINCFQLMRFSGILACHLRMWREVHAPRPHAHWGLLCMLSLCIVCAVGRVLVRKASAKGLRLSGTRRSSRMMGGQHLAISPLRDSIHLTV